MVRVMCYADTDAEAYGLATKCRTALDGNTGTHNGIYIEGLRWMGQNSYDDEVTNRRIRVHEHEYEVRVRL